MLSMQLFIKRHEFNHNSGKPHPYRILLRTRSALHFRVWSVNVSVESDIVAQKPLYLGDEGAPEVHSSCRGKGKTLLNFDNDVIHAICCYYDPCAYSAPY